MRGDTCPVPKKNFNVGAKLHNRFDIEVVDSRTGEIRQRAQAENVILDQAWEYISRCYTITYAGQMGSYGWNCGIAYGRGSGTPAHTDTDLFDRIGWSYSLTNKRVYNKEEHIYSVTRKTTLDESQAVDENISEVGIYAAHGPAKVFTHAMLQDMNGNPIVIQKTDTDIINIYSTVYAHIVADDGVFIWDTTEYNGWRTFSRPELDSGDATFLDALVGCGEFSGVFYTADKYDIPTSLSGSGYHSQTTVHDPNQKTLTVTGTRFKSDEVNYKNGICCIHFLAGNYISSGVTNAVPNKITFYFDKQYAWNHIYHIQKSIGTGNGTTTDFSIDFLPYVGTPTIKIDSVETHPTVINYPRHEHIFDYFKVFSTNKYYYYPIRTGSRDTEKILYLGYLVPGGTWEIPNAEESIIFENTISSFTGIKAITNQYIAAMYSSNDLINWSAHIAISNRVDIASTNWHDKYWKIIVNRAYDINISSSQIILDGELPPENNVHFSTPPAEGAVITAEYDTYIIPKDEDHVFDFSFTLTFGEYTEAE